MTDITIPPAALKAAEKAFSDEMLSGTNRPEPVRASCLAMLKNWPKAETVSPGDGYRFLVQHIILPLTEDPND